MLWEFLLFASFPSGPPPSVDKEDEIEIAIQEQIQDADCKEAEVKLPSPADYTGSLERFSESRRAHFKMCVLRGLQEVAQIRDQLETLKECREEQENELELLTSLKTSALQNPHTARKASNLSTAIKNLQKAYSQNQKQLYKLKRERSISEAKVDRFVSKLNQGMEYVELYATCNSVYLSPIPEESDVDLEEYELGVFPSDTNTSLAAVTVRHGQLFLDVSTSSDFEC